MKLKLGLFLVFLVSGFVMSAQPNYIPYQSRNRYIAIMADSTLHIPRFNGAPSLRTGGSVQDGAIAADTTNNRLYMYNNGSWTLINKDTANTFVNSYYKKTSTDSIFQIKGGTHTFAFTVGSGGGGGTTISDSTLQWVTNNGDSTTNRIVTNDSLKAQDGYIHGALYLGDTLYNRGDSLLAFGSSITAGSGVSSTQRFSYLIAQNYGMIEANYGGGGNTIDAVYTALYRIPSKTSNRGALMFEYNMNDSGSSDTTTWKTKMQVIIDTAVARGWTKNKIIIVGGPFSEAASRVYLANYARAARTVAETNGSKYFDAYTFMQIRGGTALTQDSVHPTALGHAVIAQAAKTGFFEFKKKGLVDVTGDVIARRRFFGGTPLAAGAYPANAVGVFNGRVHFNEYVVAGADTSVNGTAMFTIRPSLNQAGISVVQAGTSITTNVLSAQIDLVDASGYSLKIYPSEMKVGNGNLKFTGGGGLNALSISNGGAVVFNEDGLTSDFRIESDGQTHLFYTNGTTDKIGIRTSSPDSVLTVNGSVRLGSTVRFSGLPTGKQAKQIYADANGVLYLGDSTVGGSGGGTTYKIGTYNSQTSSVNGATIVSDSIYMQAFSAENPGLVPAGGSGTTYLRGDGTWQTISGGTGYVDSVSNNAGGDSLVVIKGSNRYAYKYPAAGGSPWSLTGNASLTAGWTEGNFLGTTGSQSLLIKTNNILRARIDSFGAAGIFRMYPATRTDAYLDFGTTSNNWTLSGPGLLFNASSGAASIVATANTASFYNGDAVIGSVSVPGTTKLKIDNASTTKSAINLGSTTLKTTPIAGDIDRDHSYLYVTLGSATRQKIATDIDTLTLTNKRITPRVGTTTSSSSLTIASDSYDRYTVTALAADMTLNNPSGTPTDGQTLLIRIKDDGTARALTWSGSQFRAIGVTLPTTTVISKTVYIGLIWNSADSKWDVISVNQEA
jgi:GDSL-like Lipase/Acylhydrolase family